MRRVLAVLNRAETARSVLQTAQKLNRQLESDGPWALHPRPSHDPSFMPAEEVMTSARRDGLDVPKADLARALRTIVREWESEASLTGKDHYAEIVGDPAQTVVLEARRASLTVLAHPLPDDDVNVTATFRAALYEAGASVVSTPLDVAEEVGLRPMIAWKPSAPLETLIRTIWPLLLNADHVTVARVASSPEEDADPDTLVTRLRLASISCSLDMIEAGQASVGDLLLKEASARGCDLLVMGAFSHSPLIEWFRTGITQTVLQHARIPLLMHH